MYNMHPLSPKSLTHKSSFPKKLHVMKFKRSSIKMKEYRTLNTFLQPSCKHFAFFHLALTNTVHSTHCVLTVHQKVDCNVPPLHLTSLSSSVLQTNSLSIKSLSILTYSWLLSPSINGLYFEQENCEILHQIVFFIQILQMIDTALTS